MVWKILSALSAVCLGTACYFAWANQKLLVEERKREGFANDNLVEMRAHIVKAEEAKKSRETQRDMANKELETTKTSVTDFAAKALAADQELTVVKTNLEQTSKVVAQNQKQIEEAGDIKALLAQIDVIKKERAEAEAALANQIHHLAAAQERITNLTNAAKEAEEREARGRRGIVDDDFTAKVSYAYTDWGFVVLNKGNGGGVFANADLEVKRGKDVVAKLRVRDVEQNSSVADLVKGSLAEGEHIRSGDLVVAAAEQSANKAKATDGAAPAAPGDPAAAPTTPPADAPMGTDPFGAPAAAPAAAPAPAAMGADPFGAPAPAPAPAPAAGADPFGAPPATPPAGGATPPSTADPFGAAPPAK
ncbi:MAG: hypothetical protein K9N47_24055 [Prosthecobacter sp.]|uniref:hypothetical protein n=1 Tax=Prosthecobacter sp. TaxID=1965333 RepID=UPI0026054AAC|nr:hypothetical protein [Prosthecobacter sp.]MCF7789218.1 hypothetical protein [Prosthecobacter sp.]